MSSELLYVLSGFRQGFRIGFQPNVKKLKSASSNCPSALKQSNIIDEYLTTEIQAGRVLGPQPTPPLSYLHVSRFGVIPKKNKINAWRLILGKGKGITSFSLYVKIKPANSLYDAQLTVKFLFRFF